MELCGWGRYPRCQTEMIEIEDPIAVPRLHRDMTNFVVRGNGRAYGDAAVGTGVTLAARRLDRMVAFDSITGNLAVEAGVLLADILLTFIPRGYFPHVVPGTKLATVGGMIAADVHGKNHHCEGGFGDQVESLQLALPTGETIRCSRLENTDLFFATIGGMGLTGTIVEATLRLKRIETGWMRGRTVVAANLGEAMAALQNGSDATYSVAWIDCFARGSSVGRSLIYLAEHATFADLDELEPSAQPFVTASQSRITVPFDLPGWILNRNSVATFNDLYFRRGARKAAETHLFHWDPYFFPLDGIHHWNRIYGRRGFLQHQCVIPMRHAYSALGEILERISRCGNGSFLAVLKQLGGSQGLLSFPMEGFTLAIDFPVSKEIFQLLDEVDRLVVSAGGRIYLAKDARQSRDTFEAGYPRLGEFRDFRRSSGANLRIVSHLARRLGI